MIGSMLRRVFDAGRRAAFDKFALNPPTQVDDFVASVESGKDVPNDPSTDSPELGLGAMHDNPQSALFPEEPAGGLGQHVGQLSPTLRLPGGVNHGAR
jgi:hypothetical protein